MSYIEVLNMNLKQSKSYHITKTNLTYDSYNLFFVSIYNDNQISFLINLGVTKYIFDEVIERILFLCLNFFLMKNCGG